MKITIKDRKGPQMAPMARKEYREADAWLTEEKQGVLS